MQPIEFVGFAEDCTITGKVTMFGERLTDFLNGQERFRLNHVECESLADGHEVAVDSLSVERARPARASSRPARAASEKQRVVAVDRAAAGADRPVHDPRPAAQRGRLRPDGDASCSASR